jgi:hypothetical protein
VLSTRAVERAGTVLAVTDAPLAQTEHLRAYNTPDGGLTVHDDRQGTVTTYRDFAELSDAVETVPLDDEFKRLVVAVSRAVVDRIIEEDRGILDRLAEQ